MTPDSAPDLHQNESPPPQAKLELASVLFMDIVGFSRNKLERQNEVLEKLKRIVRDTTDYQRAAKEGPERLIKLPTGDGMALVFFEDPAAPVRCAIEIQRALKAHPDLPLRAGVHTGPVYRTPDINGEANVVGPGINTAQRVMDCGDAGHILVSRTIAEVLEQLDEWPRYITNFGTFEVKHGVLLEIYNIQRDGAGVPELPSKLKAAKKQTGDTNGRRAFLPVAAGVGVLALAGAGWFAFRPSPSPVQQERKKEAKAAEDLPQRMLQYHIMEQRYRDGLPFKQPVRVTKEVAFEADYRVSLVVTAAEAGYLYIVNEGPDSTIDKPDVNGFFPDLRVRNGSARLEAGQEFATGYLQLDDQTGKERLWLVWAADPIPELEGIKKWVNTTDRGHVKDLQQARAIALFMKKYDRGNATVQTDDQLKSTVLRGTGKILVRLIELEHV